MFLLRVASKAKWTGPADDPEAVRRAASTIQLREDEDGLSVFALEATDLAPEAAARFALTTQERTGHVDSIVFEESLAWDLGLEVIATPDERLDPTMSGRHREIRGLTPELAERLAVAILASPSWIVGRVYKGEVEKFGAELCRDDPELHQRLTSDWKKRIDPFLG